MLKDLGASSYAFQEETGATGTPHLQGVFKFRNAVKWSSINNKTDGQCFWAPCKNLLAAMEYCTKSETRTGGQWVKGFRYGKKKETGIRPVVDPMEGKKFYKWQRDVMEVVEMPVPLGDRTIYWYWSSKGSTGKSALCLHIILTVPGATYSGGTFKDAFFGIVSMLEEKKTEPHVVLFDIPRAMGSMVTYSGMEGMKNGLIFSTKYKSGMLKFNIPHIVVMANQPPDLTMMSADRWKVTEITDDLLVPEE